jgi:SLT domain-containing protein
MRACLFITLCLVAGALIGCTLTATQQTAKQASSCLQDIKSSQEGQIVYAKLWASNATDTAAKLGDPNPLTLTERDALVQVHNNIISCRQTIISDNSRSAAWELPYWLDYFQRSDAIFNKLASGGLPVGLANKLTIESNGKFQAAVSRSHADTVPVDEAQQQQAAEALMQAGAQITAPEAQSRLSSINCRWVANALSCTIP